MGPTQVNGLPAHILLVHLVIVLVPVAALLVAASACWPWARRRLGAVPLLAALGALASMPITMHAGDWLLPRVRFTPQVARHIALGPTLWPWVAALFAVAAAGWLVSLSHRRLARAPRSLRLAASGVLAAAALVVAVGATVAVYRVGDSGSQAVWTGRVSTQAR